jgi:hypothetical protein
MFLIINRKRLCILFSVAAVIFTSCNSDCSKKVECPGFNDSTLSQWFPYQDNNTLIFSSVNSSDSFYLKNIETTAPYETQRGGFGNGTGDCYASKKFQSTGQGMVNMSIELSSRLASYSTTPERSVYFHILNNDIQALDLKENGFTTISINGHPCSIEFSPSVKIGNKTYSNVQKATRDTITTKAAGIYQLYIGKGNGVLAYQKYPSLEFMIKK